jgi:hypothetical protein
LIKRLFQIGIVGALICAFIFFVQINESPKSTLVNNQPKNISKPTLFTLNNIIRGIEKHHIKLTPVKDKSSDSLQLENVPPRIFSINGDKKHNLFVYVFESVNTRKQVVGPYKEPYTIIYSGGYAPLGMYETWNVLIMEVEKLPVKSIELEELKPLHIDQIVFKDFNHGKVKQYVGKTSNWKGTFMLNYYTHHWVDSTGNEKIDKFGAGEVVIHYKSKTSLKNIECEFKNGSNELKTTLDRLDNNGNITLYVSNADVPIPANLPTITITTGGKVETITLKEQ